MKDEKISGPRLARLHPKVRDTFRAFIEECEAANPETTLRISQGLRTFEEQNALFNQGRTGKGPIVTNARGGMSYHNYGLAIDLVELDGENNSVVDWKFDMGTLEPIAQKHGIGWGGNFKSIKDKPHFEITFGLTVMQLMEKLKVGQTDKEGYVIL
jgi:hypothetical protein